MDLLQGVLLTGAAATGVVVAERVRHHGSGDDVREDVVEFGSAVADQVGKAAGFVGHATGRVIGRSAEVADGVGDRTAKIVSGAGRTMARGAGATMGAYAGAIDRVVPRFGGRDEPAERTDRARSSKKAPTRKTAAKKATAKRHTTRAAAS